MQYFVSAHVCDVFQFSPLCSFALVRHWKTTVPFSNMFYVQLRHGVHEMSLGQCGSEVAGSGTGQGAVMNDSE